MTITRSQASTYASAYSAKTGRPMTTDEALVHLQDQASRKAADDARLAHLQEMKDQDMVSTSQGWIPRSQYEADQAELDEKLSATITPDFLASLKS